MSEIRVGIGVDIHRTEKLAPRPLMLGGIKVAGADYALIGHSDGDAVIHAAIDAVLGAAGLGDIGDYFSDLDENNRGKDSALMAKEAVQLLHQRGFEIINIDCKIIAEKPKLGTTKTPMAKKLSELFDAFVNVGATTPEKLGPIGRVEALGVVAIASVKVGVEKK